MAGHLSRQVRWEDCKLIRGTRVFGLRGQSGLFQAQVSTFSAPGVPPEGIRLNPPFLRGWVVPWFPFCILGCWGPGVPVRRLVLTRYAPLSLLVWPRQLGPPDDLIMSQQQRVAMAVALCVSCCASRNLADDDVMRIMWGFESEGCVSSPAVWWQSMPACQRPQKAPQTHGCRRSLTLETYSTPKSTQTMDLIIGTVQMRSHAGDCKWH